MYYQWWSVCYGRSSVVPPVEPRGRDLRSLLVPPDLRSGVGVHCPLCSVWLPWGLPPLSTSLCSDSTPDDGPMGPRRVLVSVRPLCQDTRRRLYTVTFQVSGPPMDPGGPSDRQGQGWSSHGRSGSGCMGSTTPRARRPRPTPTTCAGGAGASTRPYRGPACPARRGDVPSCPGVTRRHTRQRRSTRRPHSGTGETLRLRVRHFTPVLSWMGWPEQTSTSLVSSPGVGPRIRGSSPTIDRRR